MKKALITALLFFCAGCAASPPVVSDPVAHPIDAPPPADLPPAPIEPVTVTRCGDTGDGFDDWLAAFRRHAMAEGIAPDVVQRALGPAVYDPAVIGLDRAQKHQRRTFEAFSSSHVTPSRVRRGKRMLGLHAALLSKITKRFGVTADIIVAIWGLETDFGANQGTTPSLRALATLAYDCRRAERFRGELSSALRILQRGDLSVDDMVGAWAGELGQTQFLPSSYERFGIDFDGNGRVDLVNSTEDALASTANYLAENGWRGGEGYQPGTPNFEVLAAWNASELYRKTIALFASKLGTTR